MGPKTTKSGAVKTIQGGLDQLPRKNTYYFR